MKKLNTAVPLNLYLAHPFDSRESVRAWEMKIEKKFPMIDLVNPFYDEDRDDMKGRDSGKLERYEKLDYKELVIRDLEHISKCKGIVAVVDESRSYGTVMEIAHAFLMNKPVYIIVTNGHINHPWLQFHATELFESFGDFEKYMKKEITECLT